MEARPSCHTGLAPTTNCTPAEEGKARSSWTQGFSNTCDTFTLNRQRQQQVLEDHFGCSPGCSRAHFSKPKFSSSAGGCLTVEVNEVAPTYTGSELTLWIDMYRVGYSNSVVAKTRHLCQSIWQVHWYMSANCLRYLLKNYSNFLILKYFICTMIRKWLQRQNANNSCLRV